MTQLITHTPWIVLERAFNVRDTGGYPADGGVVRVNALLRGDSLHKLTVADQLRLIEQGLHTVIDLRHASETTTAANVFEHSDAVFYHHLPIFEVQPNFNSTTLDLASIYRHIVDACQGKLLQVLQSIAHAPEGAVLVHCTAGKDRTGVVIALALSAVGVPREHIVIDYALTTEAMKRLCPQLLANTTLPPETLTHLEKLLGSEPELMIDLLEYLDKQYGSIDAYLTHLGFSSTDRDLLRTRLIQSD